MNRIQDQIENCLAEHLFIGLYRERFGEHFNDNLLLLRIVTQRADHFLNDRDEWHSSAAHSRGRE